MSREEDEALFTARNELCAFCEVDECTYCIVTRLIDDAYAVLPEEEKDDMC